MKMYTVRETAERLEVTIGAIHKWIRRGSFPNAYKLNPDAHTSPYRIPEADILAFEEKRQKTLSANTT